MQLNQTRLFTFSLIIVLLSACISKTKKAAQQEPYFSIKDFVSDRIDSYETQPWQVVKTATVAGQKETDTTISPDSTTWARFFNLMLQSDINKPAYQGQYEVTRDSSGDQTTTLYRALKEDLKVREFEIEKRKGRVYKLQLTAHTNNLIYDSQQKLTFYPDSLYIIHADQEVVTGDKENFGIRIRMKRLE